MTRRSLATFMNALTSSDATTYPFSTRNAKDYMNLLLVYLDAAFFPLLEEDSFKQDVIRFEFQNPADRQSRVRTKVVRFHEFKVPAATSQAPMHLTLGRPPSPH